MHYIIPKRDEFLPLRVHTRYVSIIPIKPYVRRAFTSRQHTAQSPGRRTPLVRIRPFALSTPAVGLAVQCRAFGQAFGAWRAKVQGQATRPHSQLSEYGFFSGVLGVEPRSEIGLSHIATQRS